MRRNHAPIRVFNAAPDRLLPRPASPDIALTEAPLTVPIEPPRSGEDDAVPPSRLYPGLFATVQKAGIFPDSKTFADAAPVRPVEQVMREWEEERQKPGFDLSLFVASRFVIPVPERLPFASMPGRSLCDHIDALWPALRREARAPVAGTSLLPLARPYMVPGGRFDEIYYWDSYFTMVGLLRSGERELAHAMVATVSDMILRFGRMPTGNRSYYLTRSQPPVFALMVGLACKAGIAGGPEEFLPALEREYRFWMAGAERIGPGEATCRIVRLEDGTLLNRYWDDCAAPRDEAWHEDLATAQAAERPAEEVWRDLRAAAESGWDFSSRWLADAATLPTIRTTCIAPIDLNCLMLALERVLADAMSRVGREDEASQLSASAETRRAAIGSHLWDAGQGIFGDLLWREGHHTGLVSAAMLFPLFVGAASPEQAACVAEAVWTQLLKPGGLVTSTRHSGEQWDAPNGWAPLQWIAVEGLSSYGHHELAQEIAHRWIAKVRTVFEATGRLTEKYDVCSDELSAGGGEYPNQDGFGWTNGVTRELLARYPDIAPVSAEFLRTT
jgi:alpha,alpha-trehalase